MTPAEGLEALADILEDAGVRVTGDPAEDDPPVAIVLSNGSDMRAVLGDGSVRWQYRVVCLASSWDNAGAVSMLAATVAAVAGAIMAAPGYEMGAVSADRSLTIGGANRLGADVFATTTVQL